MIEFTDEQITNRVKWIRALVSGNYAQGRGALRRGHSTASYTYCCLGVARDVLGFTTYAMSYLPREEMEPLGLKDGDQFAAAEWNDSKFGFDFNRIADLIAFATANGVDFSTAENRDVPTGYATEWLKQYEDVK